VFQRAKTSAVCATVRPAARISAQASQISCMSPYSMPLCTIFTKWPAPPGPMCTTQGSPPTRAAIASNTGRSSCQVDAGPPGMMLGPLRAPSSPPETPAPTKRRPLPESQASRRSVSV
jgi:hypothetical protein